MLCIAAYQLSDVDVFTMFGGERDIFCILLSASAFLVALDYYIQKPVNYIRLFSFMIFTHNLLDEIFFSPTSCEWNEYVFGICFVIGAYAIYAIKKYDSFEIKY